MEPGKLIVIDGGDATGKTDQTERLVARMKKEGEPVETISFPRYETPTGIAVKAYLEGALGPATDVPAKQASILYAADRLAAFKEGAFSPLGRGINMVANRFDLSNMGHQGSKIDDPAARMEFFKWNDWLEHARFGIPRADVSLILHVPAEISVTLLDVRGNVKDGHENLAHLKRAEATYLELAATFPNCALIECVEGGKLLSREDIHEKVWAVVRPLLG